MRTSVVAATLVAGLVISCAEKGTEDVSAQAGSLAHAAAAGGGVVEPLASGGYHACVLARRGVKCWGRSGDGQTTVPALRNPRQLSSGRVHSCAVDDDGVKCWGNNDSGQTTVPVLHNPRQVTAGRAHTCALSDDGVKCWGDSGDGETTVPALTNPRTVVAGYHHTCALDDGGVKCWGNNDDGQTTVPVLNNPRQVVTGGFHTCALDDNGVTCWGRDTETTVPALRHPREVSAAYTSSCALDDDGIKCWGDDSNQQLEVPALRAPQHVSVGYFYSCAVDEDAVTCWGSTSDGQTAVPDDAELIGRHACLLANGASRCVGDNERGQLGVGSADDEVIAMSAASPASLGQGFESVSQVAIGRAFACALSGGGAVKCWGYNAHGQLGLGDTRDRGVVPGDMGNSLPAVSFGGSGPITAIAVGQSHACALNGAGDVVCWGDGSAGQLGTEATDDVGTTSGPTRPHLKTGLAFRALALGASHTCGLTADGAVYCFGANDAGQLGLGISGSIGDRPGTMGDAMQPVNLGDGFKAKAIASGDRHVCAVSEDGRVKCWGSGGGGELGLGDTTDRGANAADMGAALPAVDLGHGQVVAGLNCGSRHCCARMIQNTMKCWGDNSDGQLGLGDVVARGTDPTAMGDALPFVLTPPHEAVVSVQLDANRTCARTDSGLRCWGANREGELGYGDRDARGGSFTTIPRLLAPLGI